MIKKIFRLTLFVIAFIFYFFLTLIAYSFASVVIGDMLKNFIMRSFSKVILRILDIKVVYNETPRYAFDERDYLVQVNRADYPKNIVIICNHISYLDIPILLSCFKGRFVATKEIKKWPVLGWEIAMLGHIFIERGKKESYEKINNAVKDNNTVIIFPEGHTSPGITINQFKDGAFVAALKNKAPILPVVIRYNNKNAAWYGEMSLIPHLWGICDQEIEAYLNAGEIVYCNKNINLSKKVIRDMMLENFNDIVVRNYNILQE